MTMGIYRIDGPKGGVYIGSGASIENRWSNHKLRLRKGNHHSIYLQRAYDKYGLDAFKFSIVEIVASVEDLIQREQYYIDQMLETLPIDKIYNMSKVAGSTRGRKATDEERKRMSETRKGRKHTLEAIQKMVDANIGKPKTLEHRQKMSAARAHIWTFRSPEDKLVEIVNLRAFCRENNLDQSAMHNIAKCNGKNKNYKGWKHPNPECSKRKEVIHTLRSPEGEIVEIRNIKAFKIEHNLPNLHHVINGKYKQHKGWTLPDTVLSKGNPTAKTYVFKSPDDEIVEITNLAQFCKEHGLSRPIMTKIAYGKRAEYRGWTRPITTTLRNIGLDE